MLVSYILRRSLKQGRLCAGATRTLSISSNSAASPGNATLNKAKGAGTESGAQSEGSGAAGVLFFAGFAGALGAVSLQMETDPEFKTSVETYLPGALCSVFSGTGSLMRSSGVVDLLVARPPLKDSPIPEKNEIVDGDSAVVEIAQINKKAQTAPSKIEPVLPDLSHHEEDPNDHEKSQTLETEIIQNISVVDDTDPPHADDQMQEDSAVEVPTLSASSSVEPSPLVEEPSPLVEELSVPPVTPRIEVVLTEVPSSSSALENEYKAEASVFRREMERHYLVGVEDLSANELRKRMQDLVSDYAERSTWEAVRLHQSVRHVEKELADHYASTIAQHNAELELKFERDLAKRETDVRIEMSHIINDLREAQEFRIQDALKSQERALQASFDKEKETLETNIRKLAEQDHLADLAKFKLEQMNKLLDLHKSLEEALSHVAYFDKLSDQIIENKRNSARAHEASAALLALEVAMSTSRPIQGEVDAVKKLCDPNSVVCTLLACIPSQVCVGGAPTITELRARFVVAKEEARKAALAPNNAPKMIGQMIGSTLAALLWEVEGNIPGKTEEAILARASYFLDHGNLRPAFEQLTELRGYPKSLMKDWEVSAHQRLVTDQTIDCLKAAIAIEHLERRN